MNLPAVTKRMYKNPYLLGSILVLVLIAGVSAFFSIPRIEDPRIDLRNAMVLTPFPGASAARVETQVSEPIEERLAEIREVKHIDSVSRMGMSVMVISLRDSVDAGDNDEVFSRIRDRLGAVASELPREAGPPRFNDKRGGAASTLITAVRWRGKGEPALGIMARVAEELSDRLRAVPGTDFSRKFGEPREQYLVKLDLPAVRQLGWTTAEVADRVRAADSDSVAGVLRPPGHDLLVEIAGDFRAADDLRRVVLTRQSDGAVVRLGQVAEIRRGWHHPPDQLGLADGHRTIFVTARVAPNRQIGRWGQQAREVVRDYAATVDENIEVTLTYEESQYTRARLWNLIVNLLGGAGLVLAVVGVFMGWRTTWVVASALPLSVGAAVFGLHLFGQQLNQMSIFGLIIAIGLLIDNAIVMADEVRKDLRAGIPPPAAAQQAVARMQGPLFVATFTTILGFMPILLLLGNVGDFVAPIAMAVILAVSASFLFSLTVIPALTARFAQPSLGRGRWWHNGIEVASVVRAYRALLRDGLRRPVIGTLPVIGILVLGVAAAASSPLDFFPAADRNQLRIQLWLPPSADVERTTATVHRIDGQLAKEEAVRHTTWLVGGSHPPVYYNMIQYRAKNPSYAEAIITTGSIRSAAESAPSLQRALARAFPEARIVVRTLNQGPPVKAPVALRIFGPDLERLEALGREARRVMAQTPGIVQTQATLSAGVPRLVWTAESSVIRGLGYTREGLARRLGNSLEGVEAGTLLAGSHEIDVRVRAANRWRQSLGALASFPVAAGATDSHRWVPMAAIGHLELRSDRAQITHRDGRRLNNLYGYVEPGALPIEITQRVRERLAHSGFEVPPGYQMSMAGDLSKQRESMAHLFAYLPVLLMLVATTVLLAFRSLALTALIGLAGFLSVILGLLALRLSGLALGFNPILGSAGLAGVAINGSIIVLAAIRHRADALTGDPAAIARETVGTGRHILTTTLTTMGTFGPLLMFSSGNFWPPVAMVIAGGIGLALPLAMWFTPHAYRLLAPWMGTQRSSGLQSS